MKSIDTADWQIDAEHWPTLLVQVRAETDNDYIEFRKSLTPKMGIIWRDILLGYAAIAVTLWVVSHVSGTIFGVLATILGAAAIGCAIAYLQLFIHEAAHYNLAKNRGTSDKIANALIAWQVGTSIAAYRKVHFDHHRHLGHQEDGERSYAYRLSWRFIAEMVTGIHPLRIFLTRARASKPNASKNEVPTFVPLIRGVAIHALLIAGLIASGAYFSAASWIIGIAVFFPVFATIRPLLEHRPTGTDARHLNGTGDAVTRIFDDGIVARIIGGAGFNRHLLHHWEPQISYTRLADLDAYLKNTSVGAIMDARRTTYFRAFSDILEHDRGR